jgi:rare lipoprotein A (peptidoglycan hydrolase)
MRSDVNLSHTSVNCLSVTGRISTLLLSLWLSCQAFGVLMESSQRYTAATRARSVPLPGQEQLQADRPPEAVQKTKKTVSLRNRLMQLGKASWYGPGFHGKPTASGEVFDQSLMTAAHNTFPLGSRAKVTNLANGHSVEVRINDRGPHAAGRIIDLSRAAAGALGIVGPGVARVQVEVLSTAEG